MADVYERAEEKPGWYVWRYGGHWSAELVQWMFPETLAEAHRRKEALLKDLSYAFHHPGEFFKAFGHEYVVKYHQFLAAMSSGTASGEFTAGKIIGELILDILAVIGIGEAAAKWAGKIPELARIAKGLTRPVEMIKPLAEGGGAVDDVGAAERRLLNESLPPALRNPARLAEGFADRARPQEVLTAQRLADTHPEFDGRLFDSPPPPDPGYDWSDNFGKTYDALGDGTKSQYFKLDQFTNSIDSHLLKSNDFTVIDMTGYTPDQISAVRGYVNNLAPAQQALIRRVGF